MGRVRWRAVRQSPITERFEVLRRAAFGQWYTYFLRDDPEGFLLMSAWRNAKTRCDTNAT